MSPTRSRCSRQHLRRTTTLEVGLGLVPLDAFPAGQLAPAARAYSRPCARRTRRRSASARGAGVLARRRRGLPRRAPTSASASGSYGAKVLRAAGPWVDAALLNWMTPERVDWARRQLNSERGGPATVSALRLRARSDRSRRRGRGSAEARVAMARYAYTTVAIKRHWAPVPRRCWLSDRR